jgi:hypothetical protein
MVQNSEEKAVQDITEDYTLVIYHDKSAGFHQFIPLIGADFPSRLQRLQKG